MNVNDERIFIHKKEILHPIVGSHISSNNVMVYYTLLECWVIIQAGVVLFFFSHFVFIF